MLRLYSCSKDDKLLWSWCCGEMTPRKNIQRTTTPAAATRLIWEKSYGMNPIRWTTNHDAPARERRDEVHPVVPVQVNKTTIHQETSVAEILRERNGSPERRAGRFAYKFFPISWHAEHISCRSVGDSARYFAICCVFEHSLQKLRRHTPWVDEIGYTFIQQIFTKNI